MSQNGIYACQKVIVTCLKHGDIILRLSADFSFLYFFKTAAKSFGRYSDPTWFEEEISAGSVVSIGVAQSQYFLSRK